MERHTPTFNILIEDIRASMPTRPRPLPHPSKDTLGAVVHDEHSGTNFSGTSAISAANRAIEEGRSHIDHQYVINRSGTIFYTLDLGVRAFHDQGRSWSPDGVPLDPGGSPDFRYWDDHYVGILLLGGATKHKPWGEYQMRSLIALLVSLARATSLWEKFDVLGRRELPGRPDPCPKYLDLDWLRLEFRRALESGRPPSDSDPEWLKAYPVARDAAIQKERERAALARALRQRHAFLHATWKHLQSLADATANEVRSLEKASE